MPSHAGQLQLLVSALSVCLPYQNSMLVAWFLQSLINESAFFPCNKIHLFELFSSLPHSRSPPPTQKKKEKRKKRIENWGEVLVNYTRMCRITTCLYPYLVVSRGGTGDRNYSNGRTYYGNENRGYDQERPDATPMVTFTPNPAQTPGIAVNDSSVTKVRLSLFSIWMWSSLKELCHNIYQN